MKDSRPQALRQSVKQLRERGHVQYTHTFAAVKMLRHFSSNSARANATLSGGVKPMHAAVKRHVRGTGIGLLVAISLILPSAIGAAPAPVTARDSPAVAHASVRGALDADKAAAFDWLDRNADAMKALGMELW